MVKNVTTAKEKWSHILYNFKVKFEFCKVNDNECIYIPASKTHLLLGDNYTEGYILQLASKVENLVVCNSNLTFNVVMEFDLDKQCEDYYTNMYDTKYYYELNSAKDNSYTIGNISDELEDLFMYKYKGDDDSCSKVYFMSPSGMSFIYLCNKCGSINFSSDISLDTCCTCGEEDYDKRIYGIR